MPWWGNLADIPLGFVYCDGTNGTPDLRGRTILGSGLYSDAYGTVNYGLGSTGGERFHLLTIAEMPYHNHSAAQIYYKSGSQAFLEHDTSDDGDRGAFAGATGYAGGNAPHNSMMPYRITHWIMKL